MLWRNNYLFRELFYFELNMILIIIFDVDFEELFDCVL